MSPTMQNPEQLNLAELREFLAGSRSASFDCRDRGARNGLVQRVLEAHQYPGLSKKDKSLIRRYLGKLTGLGRAQLGRLIGRWRRQQELTPQAARRRRFPRRYRTEDIALLARVDEAHEGLSGAAVRRVLQREFTVHGRAEFERLAGISVAHIYNLRHSRAYKLRRVVVEATAGQKRPTWAQRRKPEPQGAPGYLRVDTVHQGHHEGQRGPYHINAVDTVTQWQVVQSCATLGVRDLRPALYCLLEQFPFRVRGFHSDNGSEYVNAAVARLLDQMLVEFTVSRPSRSTDNALVEGKNGAVVRKWLGWGLLRQDEARASSQFLRQFLNPYVNFHRPCGFAEVTIDARGRRRRRYRGDDYRTPYEKLRSLPGWEQLLKPGLSGAALERQAMAHSDTEAAQRVQAARDRLFAPALWPEVPTLLLRGTGDQPLSPHPTPPNKQRKEGQNPEIRP
ncbi:MAG: integrase catalytic domain-containing protein [Bryobacteraceae bacterium]